MNWLIIFFVGVGDAIRYSTNRLILFALLKNFILYETNEVIIS